MTSLFIGLFSAILLLLEEAQNESQIWDNKFFRWMVITLGILAIPQWLLSMLFYMILTENEKYKSLMEGWINFPSSNFVFYHIWRG